MRAVVLPAFALSLVAVGGASIIVPGSIKPTVTPSIGVQKPADNPAYVRAEHAFAELEKTPEWREIVKALGTLRALKSLPALQELLIAMGDLEVKVAVNLAIEKIMKPGWLDLGLPI